MGYETDTHRLHKGRPSAHPIDVLAWLRQHMPAETYIYLPELLYAIHRQTRASLESISAAVIRFQRANRENVGFDRTSEIFITGRTRGGRVERRRLRFFPLYNDSYISHMTLREPPSSDSFLPAEATEDRAS